MNEGQKMLLVAIYACIDNLKGAFTEEQQKAITKALMLSITPISEACAIDLIIGLEDLGLVPETESFMKVVDALLTIPHSVILQADTGKNQVEPGYTYKIKVS